MKSSTFDFEEERLIDELKRRAAKRVLIQLPEGLKPQGPRLAKTVEKTGAVAIVSADPCYGACDLTLQEAESLGADLIVHFGHTPIVSGSKHERIPILYMEAKATFSLKPAVRKALPLLKAWKHVGLTATVQHAEKINEAKQLLLDSGKIVAVGDTGRLRYAGQVIGCDYSNAHAIMKNVDAFLFVGGGRFHALGVALTTSKPTVVADPYELRAYSVDDEAQKIRKQRWASIQKALESKAFGVLIGLKSGQRLLETTFQIRDRLEKAGKKTTLLAIHEVTPESLMQYPTLDAYVNTACPRISLDDPTKFHKPVLTINEAQVVAGELTWEQLLKEGWFED